MKDKIYFSIIIPSHNSSDRLDEVLDTVIESKGQATEQGEIIVINDSSTNSFDYNILAKKDKSIRLINNKKNLGKSVSINNAVNIARGKLLVLLDDDCILGNKEILEKIIKLHKKGVDVIGGIVLSEAEDNKLESVRFNKLVKTSTCIQPKDIQGGFLIIDRLVFLSVGGYDASLKYFEDLELGFKLKGIGKKIYRYQFAVAKHLDNNLSLNNELKKTHIAYSGDYQKIIMKYPDACSSFKWGSHFTKYRGKVIDKFVYSIGVFRVIYRLYQSFYKIIPNRISKEIYNYLHRSVIYHAVNNSNFALFSNE